MVHAENHTPLILFRTTLLMKNCFSSWVYSLEMRLDHVPVSHLTLPLFSGNKSMVKNLKNLISPSLTNTATR